MSQTPAFRTVLRGYEPAQVDRHVSALQRELETLRRRADEAERRAQEAPAQQEHAGQDQHQERTADPDRDEGGGRPAVRQQRVAEGARQREGGGRAEADGQPGGATDVVAVGTVVTASVAGNEMRFLLGSREIAGDSDIDVYSEGSPLGAAILGSKVGATVHYEAPNGRAIEVQVVKVDPYEG